MLTGFKLKMLTGLPLLWKFKALCLKIDFQVCSEWVSRIEKSFSIPKRSKATKIMLTLPAPFDGVGFTRFSKFSNRLLIIFTFVNLVSSSSIRWRRACIWRIPLLVRYVEQPKNSEIILSHLHSLIGKQCLTSSRWMLDAFLST